MARFDLIEFYKGYCLYYYDVYYQPETEQESEQSSAYIPDQTLQMVSIVLLSFCSCVILINGKVFNNPSNLLFRCIIFAALCCLLLSFQTEYMCGHTSNNIIGKMGIITGNWIGYIAKYTWFDAIIEVEGKGIREQLMQVQGLLLMTSFAFYTMVYIC